MKSSKYLHIKVISREEALGIIKEYYKEPENTLACFEEVANTEKHNETIFLPPTNDSIKVIYLK